MSTILFILALLIPLLASLKINSTYKKYSKINNKKELTGFDVARDILDRNGLNNMYIVEVQGNLSDHYDPKSKVVRLSTDVYHGSSIASLAVAAHECGHAIQDKESYVWFKIRSAIYPAVNFITKIAYVLLIISIIIQMLNYAYLALGMVFVGLVFEVVTLPVELNASKRALDLIDKYDMVSKKEKDGAKKVLSAAAFTYIAAVLSDLLNILRIIIDIQDSRR